MSTAEMHTTQGTIELEFFDEDAPNTVANFRQAGLPVVMEQTELTAAVAAARKTAIFAGNFT